MLAGAAVLGINPDIATAAIKNMCSGLAVGAIFSGKMASGKDTVADHISLALTRDGLPAPVVHRTSDPIRAELNAAIAIIAASETLSQATDNLVDQMYLPPVVSAEIAQTLFETTRWARPAAEDRTNTNRYLLVYLADRGRRDVDPDYWVKKCFTEMITTLASGRTALLTGGRYPNEVFPAQVIGLMAIRIEVSPEVQLHRVKSRDGIDPDPSLFLTENECALDNYVGFNLKVTNNDRPEPTVEVILAHIKEHSRQLGGR
jgi:hypothetical protein